MCLELNGNLVLVVQNISADEESAQIDKLYCLVKKNKNVYRDVRHTPFALQYYGM